MEHHRPFPTDPEALARWLREARPDRQDAPVDEPQLAAAVERWQEALRRRDRPVGPDRPEQWVPAPRHRLEQALEADIRLARELAHVGLRTPEFLYYGRGKRWIARLVARLVQFLAGTITAHQRVYNETLLKITEILARHVDALPAPGRGNRHATRTLTADVAGLEVEIAELRLALLRVERRLARLEGSASSDPSFSATDPGETEPVG